MTGVDLSAFLPLIVKSTGAAVVLAALFGLSYVITAWRGGTVSEQRVSDMQKRLTDVEARLSTAEGRIGRLTHQVHDMRFQRDQARVRVEFLELTHGVEPRTIWAPDPPEEDA